MTDHPLEEEIDSITATNRDINQILKWCDDNDIDYTIHSDGSIDILGEPAIVVA